MLILLGKILASVCVGLAALGGYAYSLLSSHNNNWRAGYKLIFFTVIIGIAFYGVWAA